MPEANRIFLVKLFNRVEEEVNTLLLKEGKGRLYNLRSGQKPHEIARFINEILNTDLQGSTIQQKFYYELKRSKELTFKISDEYLNAFQEFLDKVSKLSTEKIPTTETNFQQTSQRAFTPSMPEFPEGNPAFPASPHYQLPIPEFKRVWIKDESFNPTGTHKDRKAYELLIHLQTIFKEKQEKDAADGRRRVIENPPISVISSGNEAYAIQTLFSEKGYRDLRVILDKSYKKSSVKTHLKAINCKMWFENLDKNLELEDVMKITGNKTGIDITARLNEDLIKKRYKFYDWLSFEILNLSPDFCFIPVGTGDLYLNVLEFNKTEIEKKQKGESRDNRFFGHLDILSKCNFIGASTKDEKCKADKLFTRHNSAFDKTFTEHVDSYIKGGFCGKATGIYEIDEHYLEIAMEYLNKLKIAAEYSGAAGLAIFFSMMENIPKEKTVVIVNTGKLKIKSEIEKEEKTVKAIMEKLKKIKAKQKKN